MIKQKRELDDYERGILRELIRNPRVSDNEIAKNTKIPVSTVNRKRKAMEEENIMFYMTHVHRGPSGLGLYNMRKFVLLKFREGITYEDLCLGEKDYTSEREINNTKHVVFSCLGEHDGYMTLMMIVDGKTGKEVSDIIHELIKVYQDRFGPTAMRQVMTMDLFDPARVMYNYLPQKEGNVKHGTIKDSWKDEWVYVDQ